MTELFSRPIPKRPEELSFLQGMDLFENLHWNSRSMATRTAALIRYLRAFFDEHSLHAIGRQDVVRLRAHLTARGLSVSYVNKGQGILKNLYNRFTLWKEDGWAGGYDLSVLKLPTHNPAKLVPMPKPQYDGPFFSPWVIRRYVKIGQQLGDYDMADRIWIGFVCRLSPIDLRELDDAEIDDESFTIRLWRKHTKTPQKPQGCFQEVKLTERLWGRLERRRRGRPEGVTRIFNNRNERKRFNAIRRVAKAEGLPDVKPIDIRRAAGGQLFEFGFSDTDRARGLAHTTTKVTLDHYTPRTNPRGGEMTRRLQSSVEPPTVKVK